MATNVFRSSCKEFFYGHLQTTDFILFPKIFSKKIDFLSNCRDIPGGHESSSSDSV